MSDGFEWDIEGGEVESPEELHQGVGMSKPGMYHFEIVKFETECTSQEEMDEGKTPRLVCTMQCLQGDNEDQIGKMTTQRVFLMRKDKENGGVMPLDDRGLKSLRSFAYAFGVISSDEVSQAKLKIQWGKLLQAQAIGKVQYSEPRKYTAGDGEEKTTNEAWEVKWTSDFWNLADEKMRLVPKDFEAMTMFVAKSGGAVPAGGSGGGSDELDDLL